jgi:hypothetical protein
MSIIATARERNNAPENGCLGLSGPNKTRMMNNRALVKSSMPHRLFSGEQP